MMPLPDPLLWELTPRILIETGSHRGDAVAAALNAGYEIYTTDIEPFCYGWCSHRFKEYRGRVHLHLEDSITFLKRVLKFIGSPAVFWLDAHWCGGNGELEGRDVSSPNDTVPLLQELQLIASHPIKSHVILIDDVRLFGTFGWPNKSQIETIVMSINQNYQITYRDSTDFLNDILVAIPHQENQ